MWANGNFAIVFGTTQHVTRLRAIFRKNGFNQVYVDNAKTLWVGVDDPNGWVIQANEQGVSVLTGPDAGLCPRNPESWLVQADTHVAGVIVHEHALVVRDPFGRIPIVGCFQAQGYVTSDLSFCEDASYDPKRLGDFLSGSNDLERNGFFRNRSRLKPGETWNIKDGFTKYWPGTDQDPLTDRAEAAARVRGLISRRCPPDSHVLSGGGLDSACLAACVKNPEIWAMVAPEFSTADESFWAKRLAEALDAPLSLVDVSDSTPLDGRIQVPLGEGPQSHPNEGAEFRLVASLPTGRPVLTGVGADQLFAVTPEQVWRSFIRMGETWQLLTARDKQRRVVLRMLAKETAPRLLKAYRYVRPPSIPWNGCARWLKERPSSQPSSRFSELESWPWELSMRQIRRHAQRAQVDLRTPFLDRALWDWVARVPRQWLLNRSTKTLLRDAFYGSLPNDILNRPKDSTFDEMIESGLRTDSDMVRSWFRLPPSQLEMGGLIDSVAFRTAFEHHVLREPSHPFIPVGMAGIWRTISAEHWLQTMKNAENTPDLEVDELESDVYEAPQLTHLGELGEVVRGTGSNEFDWGNGCTSTGPNISDVGC